MENRIKDMLCALGICDEASIVPYYPKVRDRDDVSVLKCQRSGVIFLSRSDHMELAHYETKEAFRFWGAQDRRAALLTGEEDARKRFGLYKDMVAHKRWIDVGTGAGGILDLLAPLASATVAVEPQAHARAALQELGYAVYPTIEEVAENDFDVATLFHVFEHLTDPLRTLEVLKGKLAPGGTLIIEVPHANDILLSHLALEAFKAFTFWSEHLILHTRESLRIMLARAGFSEVLIEGYQRYPLANHLHWLAKGKPGGHIAWDHLRSAQLDAAYATMLASLDCTDTLIATARLG